MSCQYFFVHSCIDKISRLNNSKFVLNFIFIILLNTTEFANKGLFLSRFWIGIVKEKKIQRSN